MGLAVARALAARGWKISVLDMNSKNGEGIAKEVDGLFFKTDVTSYESQADAFNKTWESFGRIDFGQ